ncbi:MAG: hypothetical protein C0475_02450 [Planctomyces sp.]|nr:hypothetical protein [Planctomyces sp.]
MIIPSIDLMGGQTVQLVRGRDKALDAGDPLPIARRFGVVGEVAVIDLDAAVGTGGNAALVRGLLTAARCRVGGGIRDAATARAWLDAGAERVILGTAARPEVLQELPKERVIAAVDAYDGEVVVEGWRTKTGASLLDRVRQLAPYVGGFLVTFVEIEGTMGGFDVARVGPIVEAAGGARLTVAGGITTAEQVGTLHAMGVDAQVGMAVYTGRLGLGECVWASLRSDRPDGLVPTVVCDELGTALGLAYSSRESLIEAVAQRSGVYHSRRRGVWRKGQTSGAVQELLRVDADCDGDTLRFLVRQGGAAPAGATHSGASPEGRSAFCHTGTRTCWGDGVMGEGPGLWGLEERLRCAALKADAGSYTRRVLGDAALLRAKLVEEAGELADASTHDQVAAEAADVLYFATAVLHRAGVSWAEADAVLRRRALKLTRRPGDAKA